MKSFSFPLIVILLSLTSCGKISLSDSISLIKTECDIATTEYPTSYRDLKIRICESDTMVVR